jgi:sarcosine oxidase, subunit beta
MSSRRARVVVIGGGLMGSWTAFFLRRRGISVTLIEKGAIGAQSSGVNFGNVRLQGRHPDQYPLSLRSQALWEQIETLIGERCEFERTGHVYIAFESEQDAKLRTIAAEASAHGVDSALLDPAEIRRRWPWLSPTVTSAAWSARDATANPRLVTPAVARAAAAIGAEIIEDTEVLAVERQNDGLRVVINNEAALTCDWVVNTAGAWAPAIAEMLGDTVPLFAAGPPQFVTEPLPRFILPSVQAVDGKIIFRQVERGNVVAAGYPRGPSDPVGNRAPVQPDKALTGIRILARVVPRLACAHVIRVWSGIEGYLPDMLPVIGPSTTVPRVLHAFGFCGHGFQLGPGVGAVLAEIIDEGHTPTPLAPFSIARFQGGNVVRSAKLSAEFDASLQRPPGSGA